MATTPNGWPYVLPADHPLEFPAISQQLANLLESRFAAGATLGALTPVSGWKDYGSSYGGLYVTKVGRIVTVDAMLTLTANLGVTAGQDVPIATLPGWAYPLRSYLGPGVFADASGVAPIFCRLTVQSNGVVSFVPSVAKTMTANTGWVGATCSFRSAT